MTPAELRELAAGTEQLCSVNLGLDAAKTLVPDGCSVSLVWTASGYAIARIVLPDGEELPAVIGHGEHPRDPAIALTAAAVRAKAWLMENANG